MQRFLLLILALSLFALAGTDCLPGNAQPQPRPALVRLIQGNADDFIKFFDKNKDGVLSKDELPPALQQVFDRFDKNADRKLDKDEVGDMLQALRERLGLNQANPAKNSQKPAKKAQKAGSPAEVERMVDDILQRLDTNKDGKISREEAKGRPLATVFERFDANKDGYLDREELRKVAAARLANREGGTAAGQASPAGRSMNQPDFDSFDLNADGRLTREELKGTRFLDHFDEMDTDKDGKITRKEFEAYLKKEVQKEEAKRQASKSGT